MIVKTVLAGALSLALSPLDIDFGPTTFVTHPYVERLNCDGGTGTGFKLKDGRWITVAHVSSIGNCKLLGKPIKVTHEDGEGDFTVFTVDDNRAGGIEVNCDGFKDGEWYFGIGYGGRWWLPQVKAVRASALLSFFAGGGKWVVLEANRFVPGMSGGVVLGSDGRAVGTVNAFGITQRISFSRPLRDTVICSK